MILNTTGVRPTQPSASRVTVATGTSGYTHTHQDTDTQINTITNTNFVMSDTELDDNKSEILDVCEDENITEDEVKYFKYSVVNLKIFE